MDFRIFEEKLKDYNSININNIWLLNGSKSDFEKITREYSLSFFQRINLNKSDNPILFLDVENNTISMMAKMVYEDKETKEITLDKIFYRTYSVDDIIIKLDGTIESDFEESYKAERLNFIKEYQEKLDLEEKICSEKSIVSTRNTEKYIKKDNKGKINPQLIAINYKVYKTHIDNLLDNYTEELFQMISHVCYNNITVHQIVKDILEEKINGDNIEAKDILNRITEFIK